MNDAIGRQWTLAADTSADYRRSIRLDVAVKLRHDTLTQSVNTIEKKVNGLGVAKAILNCF